jgi:hypothetical protein
VDDQDGAVRVFGAHRAYGSEKHTGDPAVTSASEHEHLGTTALFDEHVGRVALERCSAEPLRIR